jgi:cysteinyl-tRNA synthetase
MNTFTKASKLAVKLKLYNTLSRTIEEFQPFSEFQVGLYACGFTVYDYTHLGHLRKYSMDDVLVRTLREFGYNVTFVQNVTDVGHLASDADDGEDKLEKGAKKYGQSVWDVAKQFEEYFFYSMDLMGNVRPDVSCRATEHIKEQLQMVLELEKKGHTYVIEGDGVYFDTSTISDYGELARLKLDKLKEGARVEAIAGKRNPTDFALWKFERPGENRAMVWPSPWHERSFPGWHIECSAMSVKYLGEQFDIHTGGIDHIPVHHTNEIAQAENATGKKPFVKYWVHHNFLRVDGEKMSKSLGNFFTIDDILERGYSPKALRLLFLSSHYRSELNFTWENLAGSDKAWKRLLNMYGEWYEQVIGDTSQITSDDQTQSSKPIKQKLTDQSKTLMNTFVATLADDLNTAQALAVVWEVVKRADLPVAEKLQLLNYFDRYLGLDLEGEWIASKDDVKNLGSNQVSNQQTDQETNQIHEAKISELVQKRKVARENKDWATADDIRKQLLALGYEVKDVAGGKQQVSKLS